ncbi:hypothetical protein CMQ_786 [Grosmannia clavigera kw1407]|uniref:Uncharacterized protein n=1 Tax=Grosmannia clavigera (strain kw1407 / UAMH 11150) TaxID=655863 RepID=F0XEK5_GROCL|nr:uncharacterized protein CMQ_786 [Grosmannia clavigera kw1407]EFX03858.1 hypothetical protein CMQ_786 [Grosmannia clavigera kw1407]
MQFCLFLAGFLATMAISVFGAPIGPVTEAFSGTSDVLAHNLTMLMARDIGNDCFDVDAGIPGNMHWNDRDQFVTVDKQKCRPRLGLRDGTCRHNQDLSTKCSAFCQTSAFHFLTEPIALMGGKMCREGEGCEIRQEQSFHVEVSNTEVLRHVIDVTASITPSSSFGFGFELKNISTVALPEGDMIARIMAAMDEQDANMERKYGKPEQQSPTPTRAFVALDQTDEVDGPASGALDDDPVLPVDRPDITMLQIPVPTIKNPTASIAMSFAGRWTRDWTHTYHHSESKASFQAITHRQIPGEGCGSFWAAPVAVGYCGWSTSPRFPPAVHTDVMKWLHTTRNPYEGTVKMGRWGDAAEQQWNITDGRCPVNYHEFPFCYAAPLQRRGTNGQPDEALHRTVWRPYDCETGQLLQSERQPREIREQLNFNEFFKYHIRRDPRLFNPELSWSPAAHQPDDVYYDADRVADYGEKKAPAPVITPTPVPAVGNDKEDKEDGSPRYPAADNDDDENDEDDEVDPAPETDEDSESDPAPNTGDDDNDSGEAEVEVEVEGEDHIVDIDVETGDDHVVSHDESVAGGEDEGEGEEDSA